MLAQGAGVGVGLGAAHGFAVVGLGRRVDLRVFLAVAAVGEAPLTKLTLEWLLTCNTQLTQLTCIEVLYMCACVCLEWCWNAAGGSCVLDWEAILCTIPHLHKTS